MQQSSILFFALFLAAVDQASKYIVKLSFPFTTNTGAAFGLFPGYQSLFIFLSAVIAVVLIAYAKKNPYPELSLIIGGTLGNLIDRIFFGHVIDFISLGWWPSFNLADSFSTVGVVLLALRLLRTR